MRKPAAAATSFGGTEQGLKHGKNAKGTHAKILQRLKRQSTTRPCIIIMDTCPNTLYVHILSPAPLITFHSAPTCCDQSSEGEGGRRATARKQHLANQVAEGARQASKRGCPSCGHGFLPCHHPEIMRIVAQTPRPTRRRKARKAQWAVPIIL